MHREAHRIVFIGHAAHFMHDSRPQFTFIFERATLQCTTQCGPHCSVAGNFESKRLILTFDIHQIGAVADCQQQVLERCATFGLHSQLKFLHDAIVLRQTTYLTEGENCARMLSGWSDFIEMLLITKIATTAAKSRCREQSNLSAISMNFEWISNEFRQCDCPWPRRWLRRWLEGTLNWVVFASPKVHQTGTRR